jgi:hypothetical protein
MAANPDAEVGEGLIGGRNGRLKADVKAGLRVDTSELAKLKQALKDAKDITTQWRIEMEKLSKAAEKAAGNISAANGGKGGGGSYLNDSFSEMPELDQGKGGGGDGVSAAQKYLDDNGPYRGRMAKMATRMGTGAAALSQAIKPLVDAVNQRIDRGINYATSADRLNVMLQQTTGMSQMQVMTQMRQPLTEYRLGAGGVNALMQFQAQTGTRLPNSYAQSVAGIRASTGYSKSTQDILSEQQQLMDPTVANRMFFMGGTNAYNIGGGLKDPLQMRQEIVQRMGLDNPEIARSALMPGSVTRARLADMGMGEEMQTEILQYAQQQVRFREKGGKGMYDPSKKADRQMMGIEDNLATQQEETARVSTQREEQFMQRQIDNMAEREKIDQKMIEVLGKLEDTLSGMMGAKTQFGGAGRALSGGFKSIGTAMAAGSLAGGPFAPALAAAGGAMMLLGTTMGDGDADGSGSAPPNTPNHNRNSNDSSRDHEIMVPSGGRGSKRTPLSVLKRSPRMTKLQPSLREKLIRMMRENHDIGINSGYRDESEQERLFYRQMQETTKEDSQVEWNGKYWKQAPGYAFTAPPGRSMHGVGLAADIFEEGKDYSWIVANSARFGLNNWRAKGWRHDEPWHVQPQEVPRFRSQYDGGEYSAPQQSRPDGWFEDNPKEDYSGGDYVAPHDEVSAMSSSGGAAGSRGGSSIPLPALIDAHRAAGLARFLNGGSGTYGSSTGEGANATTSASSALPRDRQLTGPQVAKYAKKYFSGEDLAIAVAIAKAESGWRTGALNPNGLDNSYGLMQMNMYGDMGPARRQRWGLSSNDELYNPDTNMRAAYDLYSSTGGFSHWTTYTSGKYQEYMDDARAAVTQVGDPSPSYMPSRGRSSGSGGQSRSTTNHYTSSPTINVAPVINFNGAPATPDLKRIAQSVSKLIKEEVDMLDLRSA